MQQYAQSTEVCRSRLLLDYFGEERNNDCKQCDVCLSHNSSTPTLSTLQHARNAILQLLADNKPHSITDLHTLQLQKDYLDTALEALLSEEEIFINGSEIGRIGH